MQYHGTFGNSSTSFSVSTDDTSQTEMVVTYVSSLSDWRIRFSTRSEWKRKERKRELRGNE